MAPRRRARSPTPQYDAPDEETYQNEPLENLEPREEGEIRSHPSEMERMMQMFQQTLQHSQNTFVDILRQQQMHGAMPVHPRVQQGDPWVEQMGRLGLRRFEGGNDPTTSRKWLKKLKNTFATLKVPEEDWVRLAVYHLEGDAEEWWERATALEFRGRALSTITWSEFTTVFDREYFPSEVYLALEREFYALQQGTMTVEEYAAEFYRLEEFGGQWRSEEARADRFVMGLRQDLKTPILYGSCTELKNVILRAVRIQQDLAQIEKGKEKSRPPPLVRSFNSKPSYSSGSNSSGKRRRFQSGSYRGGSSSNSSVGSAQGSVSTRACYTCGQVGHMSPQCPSRAPITCYNCGKSGHIQRQCTEPPKRAGEAPRVPSKGRVFSIIAPDAGPSGDDVVEGEQ